jgi:uncharacterized protein
MESKVILIEHSILGDELKKKFDKLIEWFKTVGEPIIISFSGGVDSSVVLAVAVLALDRENVVAVTAVSPTYPEEDLYRAKEIVKIFNVKHILIESDELENPNFASNRCYYCKKSLAKALLDIAKKLNAKAIVDGTNASDLNTHRPGYLAFKEEGVRSPLAEVGVTKDEVRLLAKALGLPNWDKPPWLV